MGYFLINEEIIDRDDLTLIEKMTCVVLARYAGKEEFDHLLSTDIIAFKMKVRGEEVRKAINSLIEKGIMEGKPSQQNIIKNPDLNHINIKEFNSFNGVEESRVVQSEKVMEPIIREPKPKPVEKAPVYETPEDWIAPNKEVVEMAKGMMKPEAKEEVIPMVRPVPQSKPQSKKPSKPKEKLIIELKNYFSEIVSENAIRILLNIGNDDVNYIMDKYDYVKSITDHDVIDVLMEELQKDKTAKKKARLVHEEPKVSKVIKSDEPIREISEINLDDLNLEITPDEALELLSDTRQIKKANNQVNMARISSMYKQFSKKK